MRDRETKKKTQKTHTHTYKTPIIYGCSPTSFSPELHSFFIRKSTFGAEAERSYCFCQFEPEMFLRCS